MAAQLRKNRQAAINEAFDLALSAHGHRVGRTIQTDLDKGLLAVQINDLSCGPTARAVCERLQAKGVKGFRFHSLGGQYVVLDTITLLVHDMETYAECALADTRELAVGKREIALSESSLGREAISRLKRAFAEQWVAQRATAVASAL
jgi:hypothetical protein